MQERLRRLALPFLAGAALAAAVAQAVVRTHQAMNHPARGLDFTPLRAASHALTSGHDIYSGTNFLYAPTAAVLAWPLARMSHQHALLVWLSISVLSVVLSVLIAAHEWRHPAWLLLAGVVLLMIFNGDLTQSSLFLGNASLVLAVFAAGSAACYVRGRWWAGTAILCMSFLVKPLLLPILLVPLLRRRWAELGVGLFAAVATIGVSCLAVPGGTRFPTILWREATGESYSQGLTGGSVDNVAIAGFVDYHHLRAAGIAIRLLILLLTAIVIWRGRKDVYLVGGAALTGVFLVGALAETHYLYLTLPLATAAAVRARGPMVGAALTAAIVACWVPLQRLHVAATDANRQARFLLAELFVFAVFAAVAVAKTGSRRDAAEGEPVALSGLPDRPSEPAGRARGG